MLAGVIIPRYIGHEPENEQVHPRFFRAYYLDKSTFCSLGMEYDIMPIVKEINDLHKRLLQFRNKGGRLPSQREILNN